MNRRFLDEKRERVKKPAASHAGDATVSSQSMYFLSQDCSAGRPVDLATAAFSFEFDWPNHIPLLEFN